jgi:hypothetical protein
MTRKQAMFFLILNGIFLLLNMFFLVVGSFPIVNLFAGLCSLGGLASSYSLYTNSEE